MVAGGQVSVDLEQGHGNKEEQRAPAQERKGGVEHRAKGRRVDVGNLEPKSGEAKQAPPRWRPE